MSKYRLQNPSVLNSVEKCLRPKIKFDNQEIQNQEVIVTKIILVYRPIY